MRGHECPRWRSWRWRWRWQCGRRPHLRLHRISLCRDSRPVAQRPTQLSLPAGFGILSLGFARLLSGGWTERLRTQCAATGWYYDLALAFAAWAFEVDLVPALDWTRTAVAAWSGGQHRLWSGGSVINHKTNTEYDYVELLHACAFDADVRQPSRSALAPFVGERIRQRQYAAILSAVRGRGEAVPEVNSTSGQLWSCEWVGHAPGGPRPMPQGQAAGRPGARRQNGTRYMNSVKVSIRPRRASALRRDN